MANESKTPLPAFGGGLLAANNAVKDKPVDLGNVDLPAGIRDGIAELRTCKIGVYENGEGKKGKPYFMAQASVKKPTHHNGTKIEGLFTKIGPISIFDTKSPDGKKGKTLQENWDHVTNVIKMLMGEGGDKKFAVMTTPPASMKDVGQKEQYIWNTVLKIINDLVKPGSAPVHIRFRTWAMAKEVIDKSPDGKWRIFIEKPDGTKEPSKRNQAAWTTKELAEKANPYAGREPITNHDWQGTTTLAPGEVQASSESDDQSGDAGPDVEANDAGPDVASDTATEPASEEHFNEFGDLGSMDLEELGSKVTEELDAAQEGDPTPYFDELKRRAEEAGVDQTEFDNASVEESIELVKAKLAENEGGEGAAPEPFVPEKGASCKYQLKDAQGNPLRNKMKKILPPVEVTVKSVNKSKETCVIVDNASKKEYKDVPFSDLIVE